MDQNQQQPIIYPPTSTVNIAPVTYPAAPTVLPPQRDPKVNIKGTLGLGMLILINKNLKV